jgi:Zn-dependent protease
MDGSFRIGRLFGIPILIHYSFILVIPLFAWIIGSQITLTAEMLQGYFSIPIDTSLITEGFMPWILGTVIALGLFLGVLIHELAHSLVARRKGIKINSITLMIFGGIAPNCPWHLSDRSPVFLSAWYAVGLLLQHPRS